MKNIFEAPAVVDLLRILQQVKTHDRHNNVSYDAIQAFQSNLLDFKSQPVQQAFEQAISVYNMDKRQKSIQQRHLTEVSSISLRKGRFSILDTKDKEGNALVAFNMMLDTASQRKADHSYIQKRIIEPAIFPNNATEQEKAATDHHSNHEMSTYDALIMSAADYHMGSLLIESGMIEPLKKTDKQKAMLYQTTRTREQILCNYAETIHKLCTTMGEEIGMDIQHAQKPNVLVKPIG